jgi:hypothetical protein
MLVIHRELGYTFGPVAHILNYQARSIGLPAWIAITRGQSFLTYTLTGGKPMNTWFFFEETIVDTLGPDDQEDEWLDDEELEEEDEDWDYLEDEEELDDWEEWEDDEDLDEEDWEDDDWEDDEDY